MTEWIGKMSKSFASLNIAVMCLWLTSAVAQSAAPDMCLAAAEEAAAATGVPIQVLLAITLTETGRHGEHGLQPWPWALNRGGEGLWPSSKEAALKELEATIMSGATNVDIGCFQLNYHWHGAEFPNLAAMLDPTANALYAAGHINNLYQRLGDWNGAVGAYHSATPDLAERYLARYLPIYGGLGSPQQEKAGEPMPRVNRFPLLRAGQGASPGSLVQLGGAMRPLIGG